MQLRMHYMSGHNLSLQIRLDNPSRGVLSAQRNLLAQPIVHLIITALLILLSALTISNEENGVDKFYNMDYAIY